MIDPRELRIGNYVTIDNQESWPELKDIPLKVVGINMTEGFDRGVWTYNVDLNYIEERKNIVTPAHSQFIEFIKPIPLTEDILLKCGFEKGINDDYDIIYDFDESGVYYCDQITITYNTFDCCIYILQQFSDENDEVHCNNSAKIARDIKYLHDLQNLFYDLTKTELNIQL